MKSEMISKINEQARERGMGGGRRGREMGGERSHTFILINEDDLP